MKIVFFGTPPFAASILDFLFDSGVEIAAIVTQPDRPKGRSLQITSSAVKQCSLARFSQIPIFQPIKASDPIFLSQLRNLHAELFVVVAFGQILPGQLLDIPLKGCINIHASLLPKYRGAAPIQRCLMNGDKETGIAIQKMVKQLDAGDVIATAKIEISDEMTFGELEQALCELSKSLLLLVLKAYEIGIPDAAIQDHTLATYAAKISTEEAEIHWDKPAEEIHNLIRAFSPRPGAWCWVHSGNETKRIKILHAKIVRDKGLPGKILSSEVIVACGSNALKIIEIQPEGKKPMRAVDWLRGFRQFPSF